MQTDLLNSMSIWLCQTCFMSLTLIMLLLTYNPALATSVDRNQLCDWLQVSSSAIESKSNRGEIYKTILNDARVVSINFKPKKDDWRVAIIDLTNQEGEDEFHFRMLPPCILVEGRQLIRKGTGVEAISILDSNLEEQAREPQNPPFIIEDHIPVFAEPPLIALVDTGVNYLLPEFQDSIAIGNDGDLLGYDFWDDDPLPFDKDPRRNPFFPLHHGSTVFSVMDREADGIKTALYRFPAMNLCRFKALIEHAAGLGVRIINMSMGSKDLKEWECFYKVAQSRTKLLFVVSAGNDGISIDKDPIYPASFGLPNMVVVTSSDVFGRLASESNYGVKNVDFAVPAEQVEVIDHRGVRNTTGGTSYAAPRVSALAARFLRHRPNSNVENIINFLKSRSIPSPEATTRYGWIPDPTDNYGF